VAVRTAGFGPQVTIKMDADAITPNKTRHLVPSDKLMIFLPWRRYTILFISDGVTGEFL
jgi:hypothetical protein